MSPASSIWQPVDPAKGEFRIFVRDDYDDPDEPISGTFKIASVHDDVCVRRHLLCLGGRRRFQDKYVSMITDILWHQP